MTAPMLFAVQYHIYCIITENELYFSKVLFPSELERVVQNVSTNERVASLSRGKAAS